MDKSKSVSQYLVCQLSLSSAQRSRDALRASGYPGQPALLVSGVQTVCRHLCDGRVETHRFG